MPVLPASLGEFSPSCLPGDFCLSHLRRALWFGLCLHFSGSQSSFPSLALSFMETLPGFLPSEYSGFDLPFCLKLPEVDVVSTPEACLFLARASGQCAIPSCFLICKTGMVPTSWCFCEQQTYLWRWVRKRLVQCLAHKKYSVSLSLSASVFALCLPLGLGLTFPDAAFSRWYHGHMSGAQAETLLQAKGEPWTFLVRESLSQPGDFVLSVLSDQPKAGLGSPLRVTHIKVMCEVRQQASGGGLWAAPLVQGWGPRKGDSAMRPGLTWSLPGRALHGGRFGDLRQPHGPGGAFQEEGD